jgi:redox-sensing transcriptional repressor
MGTPLNVPSPAVRRLSLYLRQLETLEFGGVATVSSSKLAQPLGLTDAQVRRDLAYFGQFGRPGVGYEVTQLINRLRSIFGTDRVTQALLVGAGNLGKAVAAYQGFRSKGFVLVAVFDNDPERIGERVAHLPVQPMTELATTARRHGARLAILAVPASAAQDVANQLTAVGVRGILNFAPTRLATPPGITICNIDVAVELEQLNFLTNIESPEPDDQKEVLIVDDSEAAVVLLSEVVEEKGFRSHVARDGKEAIVSMKERRPDLVLLDIMMPRKSGINVMQEMKADPVLREVPILIVSGASAITGVDLVTGRELDTGDNDAHGLGVALRDALEGLKPEGVIEKPINPELLRRKLTELLS